MHLHIAASGSKQTRGKKSEGVTGGNNEQILILLEPNGGVHKSVALNSSGNFYYDLGGGEDAWVHTIEF